MNKLYVIGAGSGNYEDLTIKADKLLKLSDLIYCDERMFEKIKDYQNIQKIISNQYNATLDRCKNAINSAMNNKVVSILGSGDTGIYGISSIIIEQAQDKLDIVDIEIIPGITTAFSGAALLGSPLTHDFAVISLSNNLVDKQMMEQRIIACAKSDFCIVFYSPCTPTIENLRLAKEILLSYRSPQTAVGIVSDIGNNSQSINISYLRDLAIDKVNSNTTIFVGKKSTYLTKTKKMITPLY